MTGDIGWGDVVAVHWVFMGEHMMEDQDAFNAAPRTLAEQLDLLFDKVRPVVLGDDGQRLSYSQTRQHHNTDLARHLAVSAAYVSRLRHGKSTNPGVDVLRGIATFFGISATYFLSDAVEAARVEAEISYLVDVRRFEDGELAEPPVRPSVAGPHRLLSGDMPGSAAALGERLSWLFSNVRSVAADRPYTDKEVAEAIGEKPWVVRGLRTGELTEGDVSVAALRKLAGFFDTSLSMLVDDAQNPDTELLDLLRQAMRDPKGLLGVALRQLESPDARHSGLRIKANKEVVAKLLRAHLEADETMSEAGR